MEHVVYDGVDLADHFTVVGVRRQLPVPTPNLELVPGGGRYNVRSVDIVPPQITFRLMAIESSRDRRREDQRLLSSLLVRDRVVDVEFGDDDGLRYRAVPTGELALREFVGSGSVDVTLQAVEAAMRGERRTVQSSGGSATLNIGGSYPTALVIKATSAKRASSSEPTVAYKLDGGAACRLELVDSLAHSIEIDADGRRATVDGETAMITLQSPWLEAEPGVHVLSLADGSGAFSVSWEERWL